MATGHKSVGGPLCTLFHLGAIGSISDRQLLEHVARGDGEPGDFAFTALVERHGPMVLRVCSALLRDPHDAQDAFQATFLVLLRKSRELWVHDSLAPWLHRVAQRTAERAQAIARRRRECERRAAESRTTRYEPPEHDGTWSALHEEIDRLPQRLRVLVVLCHLEGQSLELVAKTFSLPLGTVKSRLHRARELLRDRLTGRGAAFPARLLNAKSAPRAADALPSLPLYESMVHAAARAGMNRAASSGLVSARAIHLFQETIKTMFLTRIRIGVALALLAGCLAWGAAGVLAQQDARREGTQPASPGRGLAAKLSDAATGKLAADPGTAPAYIRRSRTMIVERLERELALANERLQRTRTKALSVDDPEVVRATRTFQKLDDLLTRIDAVLLEAVDDFPTIFDFSNARNDPGRAADPNTNPTAAIGHQKPEAPAADAPYDEHSLAQAAERVEWSRKMNEKGYVSKGQLDREMAQYEALKARIDADIVQAAERVEWARRMFEKGYVSKSQYDKEILKHFDALKARLSVESQAVGAEVLKNYELYKELLTWLPTVPGAKSTPGTPTAKPTGKPLESQSSRPDPAKAWDDYMEQLIKRVVKGDKERTPPSKPATESTPGTKATKP